MKKANEIFEKIKDKLSPRERDVIRLHLGLDDNRQRTAEQIAELFDTTKEAIQQNLNSACGRIPKEMELLVKEVQTYIANNN